MSIRRFAALLIAALMAVSVPLAAPARAAAPIQDPGLRACINTALGAAETHEPSAAELAGIRSLFCFGRGIVSLSGAEGLVNVESLGLSYNQIADLSPLSGLGALRILQLSGNKVADPTPVSTLGSLAQLDLTSNLVQDVAGLAGASQLATLRLSGNSIQDVQPLTGLTSLSELQLAGNQIGDVSPLASLTGLTTLVLSGNPLADPTSLASLGGLTELDTLELDELALSDLSFLTPHTKLQTLRLVGNQIVDLAPLAGLTSLQNLSLGRNQLVNLSPLAGLTELVSLTLNDNQIVDLGPLAGLTQLYFLDLANNHIRDLAPLAALSSLSSFQVTHNHVHDFSPLAGKNLSVLLGWGQTVVLPPIMEPTFQIAIRNVSDTPMTLTLPPGVSYAEQTITYAGPGTFVIGYEAQLGSYHVIGGTATQTVSQRFSDVTFANSFYGDIEWLASTGITTGYADGRFGVGDPVLREQMAMFLYRAAGSPAVDTTGCHTFADVPEGSQFDAAICWLKREQITTGYSATQFGYGDRVLREQMAAFIHRAAGSPAVTDRSRCDGFEDVPAGSGFGPAICWLGQEGITTGYSPTTYGYGDPVLREQMAAFLHRWMV